MEIFARIDINSKHFIILEKTAHSGILHRVLNRDIQFLYSNIEGGGIHQIAHACKQVGVGSCRDFRTCAFFLIECLLHKLFAIIS